MLHLKSLTHQKQTAKMSTYKHTGFTISLVHENQHGEWCDLRIYSLSEEQIQSKLESYEDKIINLWEIFCD